MTTAPGQRFVQPRSLSASSMLKLSMVAWSTRLPRGRHAGGCANQESVLRRNVLRDPLCPDVIPLTGQAAGSHDVDREGIIHPPGERASVADADLVTTGQHRHTRARDHRELQNEIRQPTTGMNGYDNVSGQNLNGIQRTRHKGEASGQAWPTFDERLVQRGGRGRHHGVDRQRARRGVIEDQHQLREQPVASGEIDDPAASKPPAHPARGLPRFIQLLAGKTPGMAGGAADAIKECFARKARKVFIAEAPT